MMKRDLTYVARIDGAWYAFGAVTEAEIAYTIGKDARQKGYDVAHLSCWGIPAICTPSPTRESACRRARRAGQYCGVLQL